MLTHLGWVDLFIMCNVSGANRSVPTESDFGKLFLDGLHVPDRNAAVGHSHGDLPVEGHRDGHLDAERVDLREGEDRLRRNR